MRHPRSKRCLTRTGSGAGGCSEAYGAVGSASGRTCQSALHSAQRQTLIVFRGATFTSVAPQIGQIVQVAGMAAPSPVVRRRKLACFMVGSESGVNRRLDRPAASSDSLRSVLGYRVKGHIREAAINVKAVPGIGAELVLTIAGELRKTRLFRSHEQAELGRRDCGHADDVSGGRGGRDAGAHGGRARGHQPATGGRAVTIELPLSGETFEAELKEDDGGVLSLHERNRVSDERMEFYLLEDVLKIGWRIVRASPEEQALLDAHGFGSGRAQ
jgi:hypothetical protein